MQENRLSFSPVENKVEHFDRIEELGYYNLPIIFHIRQSRHTVSIFSLPTNEFGSEDLVNLIRPKDLEEIERFGASLTSEEYTRHLKLNGRILNLTIGLKGKEVSS